jgi:transposase
MARPQKQYSEEQKAEVKEAYKKSRKSKEQKRLLCVRLRVCKGYTTNKIAEIVEFKPTFVDEIISRYNRKGISDIAIKKQGGNRRNLTDEQEKEFLKTFQKQAEEGHMLVTNEIQTAYEKLVGKRVPKATVYNMLHRNGWRKIMPRSKHPNKASNEAIEAYKKNV